MVPGHCTGRSLAGSRSRPAVLLDDHGALHDRLEVEDPNLGLVDDRGRQHRPELAGVGDRERPPVDVVGVEPPARARSATSAIPAAIPSRLRRWAWRITGTIRPCSRATAIPRLISSW